jgi:hypothetical protein
VSAGAALTGLLSGQNVRLVLLGAGLVVALAALIALVDRRRFPAAR